MAGRFATRNAKPKRGETSLRLVGQIPAVEDLTTPDGTVPVKFDGTTKPLSEPEAGTELLAIIGSKVAILP